MEAFVSSLPQAWDSMNMPDQLLLCPLMLHEPEDINNEKQRLIKLVCYTERPNHKLMP